MLLLCYFKNLILSLLGILLEESFKVLCFSSSFVLFSYFLLSACTKPPGARDKSLLSVAKRLLEGLSTQVYRLNHKLRLLQVPTLL
jgi:hypothetical protein